MLDIHVYSIPEERYERDMAVNAGKFRGVISDMLEFLRAKRKNGSLSKAHAIAYENLWTELHRIIREHGLEEV